MSFRFTVIKKNQILACAVTLMLVTAGYLNYKYDPTRPYDVEITGIIEENLGDAVLVDANGTIKDINAELNIDVNDNIDFTVTNEGATPVFKNNTDLLDVELGGNTEQNGKVSSNTIEKLNDGKKEENVFKEIDDYYISTKIDRTNSYAEQIEGYEKILDSANSSNEQKNKAQEEIEKINKIRNSIMIAENLIKLKGFDETVILVNEKSINVIIETDNLSSAEIAQIQSIIMNEFTVDIDNVHIISYE